MSTFRDELIDLVAAKYQDGFDDQTQNESAISGDIDTLLASPAMQAIRTTLLEFAENSANAYNDRWAGYRSTTVRSELADVYDLPESVVDWVMEGNE